MVLKWRSRHSRRSGIQGGAEKMTHNDSIMNHCPHCDSLCLLSQSEVDTAQAANKAIAITCHQCNAQFGLDHSCPPGTKRARPAEMKIIDCPSCKMAITIPTHRSSDMKVDLFCPYATAKSNRPIQTIRSQQHQPHRRRRQVLLPRSTVIMPTSQTATPA